MMMFRSQISQLPLQVVGVEVDLVAAGEVAVIGGLYHHRLAQRVPLLQMHPPDRRMRGSRGRTTVVVDVVVIEGSTLTLVEAGSTMC
jgi:hypothetical protein